MQQNLKRRKFLKVLGMTSAGLALGFRSGRAGAAPSPLDAFQPNRFLVFQKDGFIRLYTSKTEMGQGTNTSIRLLAAEELCISPQKILLQVKSPETGFFVGTGGSWGMAGYWRRARPLFAVTRQLFINAAAKKWGVDPAVCNVQNGSIECPSTGQKLPYEALLDLAAQTTMPEEAPLIPPEAFRYLGRPHSLDHLAEILTGKAKYGIDQYVDGMLYASIERCPVVGGTLRSVNSEAAEALDGVKAVIPIEGTPWEAYDYYPAGVAVLATNSWIAQEGRKRLKIEWNYEDRQQPDSGHIWNTLRRKPATADGIFCEAGPFQQHFAEADLIVEAEYETPFWAHLPMETMNAIAHYRPAGCDIWAACHMQTRLLEAVKRLTGLEESQITIHTPLLGGSFGRRLLVDYAIEALLLSKAAGCPVQVLNTRIDETKFGHFLSGGCYHFRAAIKQDRPLSMELNLAQLSVWAQREPDHLKNGVDNSIGDDLLRYPYHFPSRKMAHALATEIRVPVLWWRGTYANTNGFIMESWIDELAAHTQRDPLAFRLALLENAPNLQTVRGEEQVDKRIFRKVLESAAQRANWHRERKAGTGRGIAACFSFFESYAAVVAEVSVNKKRELSIGKLTCAIECGFAVNPNMIEAQIQSGIVFSLSAMTDASIGFRDGRVVENSFADYPILKYAECPEIEVVILDSDRPACGVGELSNIPTFAAVCNAIYNACGLRIRSLPLSRHLEVS